MGVQLHKQSFMNDVLVFLQLVVIVSKMLQRELGKLPCVYVCVWVGLDIIRTNSVQKLSLLSEKLKNRPGLRGRVGLWEMAEVKKKNSRLQNQRQLLPHLLFYFSVQLSNHSGVYLLTRELSWKPSRLQTVWPALCQGKSGKRVEVVGIFSSVSVAQGILWVMLEDKFLSLLEPWDYLLHSPAQEPHDGPRALS